MNRFCAPCLALLVATSPVAAQDGTARDDIEQGFDLLHEGSRLMLRGLLDRLEPALRDLEGALDDLNAYHPPEILPNGDILIRRRVPLPPPDDGPAPDATPEAIPQDGEAIDL